MNDITLGRLLALTPSQKDVLIAPTNMFVPAGPRLGASGHMGAPPKRPLPKGYKPPVVAAAPVASEDDDADSSGSAMSDIRDGEEPDHGESSFASHDDDMIASSSSEDEAPLIPAPQKKKKSQSNPLKGQHHSDLEPDPVDYESRVRRLLNKSKTDPLPQELIEWSGSCSEAELQQHMIGMNRLNAMIRINNGAAMSAKRLLTLHSTQGTGELFHDSLKAHCALRTFHGQDVSQDMLRGCYVLNDKVQ